MSAEPRWRVALTSWLAVYPTITAVGALALPFTESLPWAARTFVMTTIMVPLVVYVTGPAARALLTVAAGIVRGLSTRHATPGRRAASEDTPPAPRITLRAHVASPSSPATAHPASTRN